MLHKNVRSPQYLVVQFRNYGKSPRGHFKWRRRKISYIIFFSQSLVVKFIDYRKSPRGYFKLRIKKKEKHNIWSRKLLKLVWCSL